MMKYFTLLTFLTTLLATTAFSQYETVLLNYEKSYFGENQPLPAEKYFIVNGTIRPDVQYVELDIYKAKGKEDREPISVAAWKRDFNNSAQVFNLPVNYKLKEGKDYDYLFSFFRTISSKERAKLTLNIYETLDAYVEQSFNMSSRKLKLMRNNRQVINDLNQIVDRGMSLYRSRTQATFPGFSDMVKLKLKQVQSVKLKRGKKLDMATDSTSANVAMRNKLLSELKQLLHSEVAPYLNAEIYVLADDKYIDNYPTESVRDAYYLSPHFGYGGVAFSSKDKFEYGSNMYVGLSFPLGKARSNNFWSKTSLSVGAFLGDFKDKKKNTRVSGPLFKVPTYVSLGYRAFSFFRIQAGAAFLENITPENGGEITGMDREKVYVRPFVGISAELNVWFNMSKN